MKGLVPKSRKRPPLLHWSQEDDTDASKRSRSAVAMKYYLAALESEYVACGRSGAHPGVAVRDYGCTSRPTRPLESSLPPQ